MKLTFALYASLLLTSLVGCMDDTTQEPPQTTPQTCGTIAGLTCSEGQYCSMEPEGKCRIADADGVCKTRPDICTEEYVPVCGCDDKTYSNVCYAAMEGVSVLHAGECATTPAN